MAEEKLKRRAKRPGLYLAVVLMATLGWGAGLAVLFAAAS